MIFQLFIIFTYLSIFVSFISRDTAMLSVFISLLAVSLGIIHIVKSDTKMKLPKFFPLMFVFVLVLQIYLPFVKEKLNPLYYALVMSEGLAYWFIFTNLKDGNRILKSLLTNLTIFYSFIFFLTKILNISFIKLAQLIFTQDIPNRHYYFGAICSLVIIIIIYKERKNIKILDWITLILSSFFLALSNNRTAYLSFILGVIYLVSRKTSFFKLNKFLVFLIISGVVGLFILSSINKTTLFDRPYFSQSIQSFVKYPLGVGMGNFKQIARGFSLTGVPDASLSVYTHNIYLETLSGVGVFSIIFLAFLFFLTRDILQEKGDRVVWGSLVLILLTNFMFDTSYTVAGMIWILFITIGVFQSSIKKGTI